jgi:phosphohistidine phosphatase SixA
MHRRGEMPPMRHLAVVCSIALALSTGLTSPAEAAEAAGKGLILLVRHAERPPMNAPTDDPSLTDAGKARAARLATVLADADIRTIFITRFRRTQETAAPIAAKLKLTPAVESDTDGLVTALKARGDATVLVVGHSDTLPDVIKAFGGPAVTIGDDDFDDLFVLVPGTGGLTRLAY